MLPAKERIRCGGREYVLLRKENTPRIVELSRLAQELEEGAEYYSRAEEQLEKDWVLIPVEHFQELEREGCLEKCMTEELEELREKGM